MVEVFKDQTEASKRGAGLFCQIAINAVKQNGRFTVALTGGSSPIELYRLLTTSPYKEQVPWPKTFVFWGDERWVPLTDEKSNAKMSFETLLDHVPVPKANIFEMWNDEPPEDFALKYEKQLQTHFASQKPSFNLILLGMGDDGHTASLFPGTKVLHENNRLVVAYYLQSQSMYRITLTAACINLAQKVMFLVFGETKAFALNYVLQGEKDIEKYPAQLIQPINGEVLWLVDEKATVNFKR